MNHIRSYIENCSRGDWFVLYQLSKNLNRPFFMDFLTNLARVIVDPSNPACLLHENDEGDGLFDLMLK